MEEVTENINADINNSSTDNKHNKVNKKKVRWIIMTCLLIGLFTMGSWLNEGDFLGKNSTGVSSYLSVYSTFFLLLIYIVPIAMLIHYLADKENVSKLYIIFSVMSGSLIASSLAGQVNGSFDDIMRELLGKAYSEDWLGSFETGIAEEVLKLFTAWLIIYVFSKRTKISYVLTGISVGLGFQIEEDISYITDSGFKHIKDAFPTAIDRISASVGSHWAYAGVTALGLYLISGSDEKNHKKKGFGLIFLVIIDHFLYDTPLGSSLLMNMVLTVITILPLVFFINKNHY